MEHLIAAARPGHSRQPRSPRSSVRRKEADHRLLFPCSSPPRRRACQRAAPPTAAKSPDQSIKSPSDTRDNPKRARLAGSQVNIHASSIVLQAALVPLLITRSRARGSVRRKLAKQTQRLAKVGFYCSSPAKPSTKTMTPRKASN